MACLSNNSVETIKNSCCCFFDRIMIIRNHYFTVNCHSYCDCYYYHYHFHDDDDDDDGN